MTRNNNKETCPCCGYRTRYPEHPLCPYGNSEYVKIAETAKQNGQKIILTRIDYAKQKGVVTLERLRSELAVAQRQEQEKQQPFWNKAHTDVRASVRTEMIEMANKVLLYQRAEIPQIGISRDEYNKKVGVRFNELWNADEDNKKLSRKVYGLRKAVESLKKLLESFEQQNKESEKAVVA